MKDGIDLLNQRIAELEETLAAYTKHRFRLALAEANDPTVWPTVIKLQVENERLRDQIASLEDALRVERGECRDL